MKLGSVIFYKNIPSFLSWVQRFVLKTKYSHLSICRGKDSLGLTLELEANIQVDTTTYHPDNEHRDVYEFIDTPEQVIKTVLIQIIHDYEEKTYGFISWLTIFIRRIFELLGFDAKGWNILWGWGIHCSELGFYYLMKIAVIMLNTPEKELYELWLQFKMDLEDYNPNLFTPPDAQYLMAKHYKLFRKV